MDFHIGSDIVDTDGDKLGTLRHVIVDQTSNKVIEVVLGESGMLGRDVLVPIDAVKSADTEFVIVGLAKDDLEKLQTFAVANYITSPADSAGPFPAGALLAPGMAPVGAATGIETIGMMPIVEVEEQIPEGSVDLEPGTEVWATDGKVGHIRDVLVDDQSDKVRGFVVEKGVLFHREVEISMDEVGTVGQDRVTLKVTKEELIRR